METSPQEEAPLEEEDLVAEEASVASEGDPSAAAVLEAAGKIFYSFKLFSPKIGKPSGGYSWD